MSRPSSKSRSRPPAPAPQRPQQPVVQIQSQSLTQTLKEGFAFGAGSAAAHAVIGSLFGGQRQPDAPATALKTEGLTPYEECMKHNSYDHDKCIFLLSERTEQKPT